MGLMKTEQEQIKIMTKDEVKRALKMCADNCFRICCPYGAVIDCCSKLKRDALTLITEQEKSIQVAQDNILTVSQQNQEYREQRIKQAKIDMLNELKEKCKFDGHTVAVYKNDIDELIKEIRAQ